MTKNNSYDYAIIGAGAAGLNLALAFLRHPFFATKSILILEKSAKQENDRTWSFWEKGTGHLNEVVHHSWTKAKFQSPKYDLEFDLSPYSYKTVRGADFYAFAKKKIAQAANFTWIKGEVESATEGQPVAIKTSDASYFADMVFDSRISQKPEETKNATAVLQHFKGWIIETPKPQFSFDSFTMMDYRTNRENSTSFTYILPFSPTKALVEFTLFSPDLLTDDEYIFHLKKYIREQLNIEDYSIVEEENGIIPMSDFPFHEASTKHILKIGTAGSWVKPSSGYSFKNAQNYSAKIAELLAKGKPVPPLFSTPKFRLYDSVFLDVLRNKNHLGPMLFELMYAKNKTTKIFKFLDEETSFAEELKIMSTFPKSLFSKILMKKLLQSR